MSAIVPDFAAAMATYLSLYIYVLPMIVMAADAAVATTIAIVLAMSIATARLVQHYSIPESSCVLTNVFGRFSGA